MVGKKTLLIRQPFIVFFYCRNRMHKWERELNQFNCIWVLHIDVMLDKFIYRLQQIEINNPDRSFLIKIIS